MGGCAGCTGSVCELRGERGKGLAPERGTPACVHAAQRGERAGQLALRALQQAEQLLAAHAAAGVEQHRGDGGGRRSASSREARDHERRKERRRRRRRHRDSRRNYDEVDDADTELREWERQMANNSANI